jgi:phosphoribosylformimino-5-aminoimidazole carboxamide ribotide isomerase
MNPFTIYPAIDLRAGRVVRLKEGDPARQTIYGHEPGQTARHWLEAGAHWLHVVNLDGAFGENDASNQEALRSILDATKDFQVRVQFGGGVRSLQQVAQLLNLGLSRVVLGTSAIERPQLVSEAVKEFGGEKIAVGIDAREGQVRVRGWTSNSEIPATDLALRVLSAGIQTIIFTDIARDGLGSGLNISSTRELAESTGLEVIASGGVHTLADVFAAREAKLSGVIIGRALYEGTIDLSEALGIKGS